MTAVRQLLLGNTGPASSAVLSPCGMYRYRLTRRWGNGKHLLAVLHNPSDADASVEDPTVRKVVGFAKRWGFDAIEIVNPYAYRSPDPKALLAAARTGTDVIGPDNDLHIMAAGAVAPLIVVGWGAIKGPPGHLERLAHVVSLLPSSAPLYCFGSVGPGGKTPQHPLMAGYTGVAARWR